MAELLCERLSEQGFDAHMISFAHDMKQMAEELFGLYGMKDMFAYECYPEQREVPLEGINKSPRQLWIEFGNAVRQIHPDIWIDRIEDYIRMFSNDDDDTDHPRVFIITDVRYPNEVAAIRSWGGLLLKVVRPSTPKSDDVADCALDGFTDWDDIIENRGDLADLDNSLAWLMCRLLSHAKRHDHSKPIPQHWRN